MEKLKKIIISPRLTIKHALKLMDEAGEKTLLIADNKNKLLGTLTDGDVRRWVLKKASLRACVSKAMNGNPIFLKDRYSKEEAKNLMISKVIECIPIVDAHKRIISAIWWLDLFDNSFKKHKPINIPVVIMAGGEGSRLFPVTNVLPKPLIPIGDKPMIELIIEKFTEFGCKSFYLSINYKAHLLKAYFSEIKHDYKVKYVQEDNPLGTAGSLYLLKNRIKDTFFVSNCDILIEGDYCDILKYHQENKNSITLIVSMKHYVIPYGVCLIKSGGSLKEINEKPEYDFLINSGMYILEQEVLQDIPRNKVYHITDLINNYIKKGKKVGVYPVSDKSWFDMGQWQELQSMLNKFGKR